MSRATLYQRIRAGRIKAQRDGLWSRLRGLADARSARLHPQQSVCKTDANRDNRLARLFAYLDADGGCLRIAACSANS
jgi:hypothetical protein